MMKRFALLASGLMLALMTGCTTGRTEHAGREQAACAPACGTASIVAQLPTGEWAGRGHYVNQPAARPATTSPADDQPAPDPPNDGVYTTRVRIDKRQHEGRTLLVFAVLARHEDRDNPSYKVAVLFEGVLENPKPLTQGGTLWHARARLSVHTGSEDEVFARLEQDEWLADILKEDLQPHRAALHPGPETVLHLPMNLQLHGDRPDEKVPVPLTETFTFEGCRLTKTGCAGLGTESMITWVEVLERVR